MIANLISLVAVVACLVIVVRCVCVLYHTHWTRHPRRAWHWVGFGYSYVLLAAASVAGTIGVVAGDAVWIRGAVLGLLAASAGLIAFDRRRETCNRAPNCAKRVRP